MNEIAEVFCIVMCVAICLLLTAAVIIMTWRDGSLQNDIRYTKNAIRYHLGTTKYSLLALLARH